MRGQRIAQRGGDELRRAVELGSPRAAWELGWAYDLGVLGLVEDETAAAALYRRSAEAGYGPGQAEYALALHIGAGVELDEEQSQVWAQRRNLLQSLPCVGKVWAKRALASGDEYAVGLCHESGLGGLREDDLAALECYKRSAATGFAAGQHRAGALSSGTEESFYMTLAAKQGHALAQYDLGYLLRRAGNVVDAHYWWSLAAAQMFTYALNKMAWMHFSEKLPYTNWPRAASMLVESVWRCRTEKQEDYQRDLTRRLKVPLQLTAERLEELYVYGRFLSGDDMWLARYDAEDSAFPLAVYVESRDKAGAAARCILGLHRKRGGCVVSWLPRDLVVMLAKTLWDARSKPSCWALECVASRMVASLALDEPDV